MTRTDEIKLKLQEMKKFKMISGEVCRLASNWVSEHETDFSKDTGMSVSEAADCAIDIVC